MRFILGGKRLLIIDRTGVRVHKATKGNHFERQNDMIVLKPDSIDESPQEIADAVEAEVRKKTIDYALQLHAEQTKGLLERVLNANDASEAAEMVGDELRQTEEAMQNRQEGMKV